MCRFFFRYFVWAWSEHGSTFAFYEIISLFVGDADASRPTASDEVDDKKEEKPKQQKQRPTAMRPPSPLAPSRPQVKKGMFRYNDFYFNENIKF